MSPERFVRCSDYLGVIGKAEVVIRAQVNDRVRLAVVIDARVGVGARKEFGLVELRGPRALAHPRGERGGSLEGIAGFASEKVT